MLGFVSAPGADELSAFLSGSPRDAVWDSQAEPTHGESRGTKCECAELCTCMPAGMGRIWRIGERGLGALGEAQDRWGAQCSWRKT